MDKLLQDKVALVTGGGQGLGQAICWRLVREGCNVVVADLNGETAIKTAAAITEHLQDEAGSDRRAIAVKVDVTDEDQVAAMVDRAVTEFGSLDILVSNAGVLFAGEISEFPADKWRLVMNVNLFGYFLCAKHAARVMVPQGSGSILSTSSTAGITGGLGSHAYTACKHAVIGLTKSVASELAPKGVRVNAIAPGNTVTAMTADVVTGDHTDVGETERHIREGSPLGIAGTPDDIALAAVYLASDEARYVTGHTLVVDAGQTTAGRVSRFHRAEPAEMGEAGARR